MSASRRLFALRSTFRATGRRAVPRVSISRQLAQSAGLRGYATSHDAAPSSEMPWLIAAVVSTVGGLAYLLAPTDPTKTSDHHIKAHHEKVEEKHDEEKDASSTEDKDKPSKEEKDESSKDKKDKSSKEEKTKDEPTEEASKKSKTKSDSGSKSQTGKNVPPPPADNSSGAEKTEDKKEAQEQNKKTMEKKDTKVATSSSDMPSKKTESEHPREDPKKGEGEGVKKGGNAKDD